MHIAFPGRGNWLGACVDLAGSCVMIGLSLVFSEGLQLQVVYQVLCVVLAMWIWDWLYSRMSGFFGAALDRRGG